MKKIFALALAAVMTAGMATTSFATSLEARNDAEVVLLGGFKMVDVYVDSNDNNRFNESDDTFTPDKGSEKTNGKFTSSVVVNEGDIANVDLSVVKGGKKVAIPLLRDGVGKATEKEDIRNIKVKTDWKVGELTEKPEIEFVKIGTEYVYAVTFTLPEGAETKYQDLAGEVSIYKNSSDLKENSGKVGITLNFGAEYGYTEKYLEEVEDDMTKAQVVIFKDKATDDGLEGEETLTFGDFEFEVDVTGQGKLNLKNNVDFNKEFAAMYDYANIDFITFEKEPTFNKNGTAYIYADEDAYIYEVTADGAKEIKGLKWDEDYEAWSWKTRTLKSYAISDVELTEKTVTEDKDDTTTDGGKTNPDTGR